MPNFSAAINSFGFLCGIRFPFESHLFPCEWFSFMQASFDCNQPPPPVNGHLPLPLSITDTKENLEHTFQEIAAHAGFDIAHPP